MIYFDNGATTFPKPKSVVNAVNYAITKSELTRDEAAIIWL